VLRLESNDMRILVIDRDLDAGGLREVLLRNRISDDQADAAMRRLADANRHLDVNDLSSGAVLFIPETAEFRGSASEPVGETVLKELQDGIRSALDASSARIKAGNQTRAAERAEVAAALKSAAVKRLLESEPNLRDRLNEAVKGFKQAEKEEADAEAAAAAASKGALNELAALAKLMQ
jgi:hypothetical protein